MKHINDRGANFYSDGQFFLIRCYCCGGERGRENYIPTAATGQCAWCGWKENERRITMNEGKIRDLMHEIQNEAEGYLTSRNPDLSATLFRIQNRIVVIKELAEQKEE